MVKQKRQLQKGAALVLLLALSPFLLLAGCKSNIDLPFYQFESYPEAILIVDGIRYIDIEDTTNATGLFWNLSGEIEDAIGVCGGNNAERGGGFDVCPIEGDEEQNFFFVLPNHFVFGPYYTYFCIREDLQISPPSAETVSSVALVFENEDSISAHVDNPAMIAALLEAYSGDGVQVPDSEDWVYGSLIMHHKDFPFLQYEIEYRCSLELEMSYCQNKKREWLPLPAEWYVVISEHDFPTRDE